MDGRETEGTWEASAAQTNMAAAGKCYRETKRTQIFSLVGVGLIWMMALSVGANADWIHDVDAKEASITADSHRLAVACTGPGELTVYYAIPADALRPELEELPPVILMLARNGNATFSSYNASGIDYGNEVGFGFRGPATQEVTRQFSAANSINVGIALRDHGDEFSQYNPASFPGTGSSKAIGALLDMCN